MPSRFALFLLVLALMPAALTAAKPKDWEPSIKAFEIKDQKTPPPSDPILFVGSSSIRGWDLKKSFPQLPTINRGFGGSEVSDSIKYFDRIVTPYQPRLILLYAGDNDISNGESAEEVVADYQVFAKLVCSKLPQAHFAFLPIKPSIKRWNLWPEMKKANDAIRKLCENDKHLHYLDTVTPMMGKDRKPIESLFVEDGLHLSKSGYHKWNKVVLAWIQGVTSAPPATNEK